MDQVDTSIVDTIKMLDELKERGEKKAYALKLCVFATILGYIASIIAEASRASLVYVVLSNFGKEVCSFLSTNETNGG